MTGLIDVVPTAAHVTAWVVGVLLLLDAVLLLHRTVKGPSVLNRALAADLLTSTLVCALGAEMVLSGHTSTMPLLVTLALLAFVGSTAVARFVARDSDETARVREARRRRVVEKHARPPKEPR